MFDDTPLPIIDDKFYGVWVNRISVEKRPEMLVELASLMKDAKLHVGGLYSSEKIFDGTPNIEIHVIGSGPLEKIFDGIPNIMRRGFISDLELSRELQEASFFVSTSRGEVFGMSAIEAMAYGVPTIVPDVQGLRDFGRFISPDIEKMLTNIAHLWTSYALYNNKIQNPTGFSVEAEYSPWGPYRRQLRIATLQKFSDAITIPRIKEMLR